jgi:hypothetical protein
MLLALMMCTGIVLNGVNGDAGCRNLSSSLNYHNVLFKSILFFVRAAVGVAAGEAQGLSALNDSQVNF